MKTRLQNPSAIILKQEFLRKWIKGLQIYTKLNKGMSILERKKAIKLSADVAMASTRNSSTNWSRALMAGATTSGGSAAKIVVEQISDRKKVENNYKASTITCSKKIVKRSHVAAGRMVRPSVKANNIAKRLVKNRTCVLKRLVPGGQQMDEICLIKETLDYIASLQVQVDVMRRLAAAAENNLDPPKRSL